MTAIAGAPQTRFQEYSVHIEKLKELPQKYPHVQQNIILSALACGCLRKSKPSATYSQEDIDLILRTNSIKEAAEAEIKNVQEDAENSQLKLALSKLNEENEKLNEPLTQLLRSHQEVINAQLSLVNEELGSRARAKFIRAVLVNNSKYTIPAAVAAIGAGAAFAAPAVIGTGAAFLLMKTGSLISQAQDALFKKA